MDDMTLITAPQIAERCYAELKEAQTRAGMKLSEDKCTAWTTDGKPRETPKARALWGNARDHRGFVVCGFPATCEDPASEAALAFPIGDPNYVEAFLEARTVYRGTHQADRTLGDNGERIHPGGPIVLLAPTQQHSPESRAPP